MQLKVPVKCFCCINTYLKDITHFHPAQFWKYDSPSTMIPIVRAESPPSHGKKDKLLFRHCFRFFRTIPKKSGAATLVRGCRGRLEAALYAIRASA